MVIIVPSDLRAKIEAYMGIIIRDPCGCALCREVNAFYETRRKQREAEKAEFDAMIYAADPPRYQGMIAQLRVGKNWPGITIDQPRTDNWIRDCIEGG